MQEPSAEELSSSTIRELDKQLDALQKKAVQRLIDQVCMRAWTFLSADPPMALTISTIHHSMCLLRQIFTVWSLRAGIQR